MVQKIIHNEMIELIELIEKYSWEQNVVQNMLLSIDFSKLAEDMINRGATRDEFYKAEETFHDVTSYYMLNE